MDTPGLIQLLQLAEYRAFKWALLGGVLFWLPAALVLLEALSGVNALERVHFGWFVGNLVFGLVALVVGQALSKKYVERPDLTPWACRLVDALSDRALRSTETHLAELSTFTREPSPPAAAKPS